MASENSFYSAVKHLRLIHYMLVIVSGVILYLAMSVQAEVTAVRRELKQLKQNIDIFKENRLLPQWENERAGSILKAFEKALGITIPDSVEQIKRIKESDRNVFLTGIARPSGPVATLDEWQKALKKQHAKIIKTLNFSLEISEWAKKNTFKKLGLSNTMSQVWVDSFSSVSDKELKVRLHLQISFWTKPEYIQTTDKYETVSAGAGLEDTKLVPDKWFFKTFPSIIKEGRWKTLRNKTIEDAVALVDLEFKGELDKYHPVFLGITVHGSHIGYIGIILLASLLVYLLMHLKHVSLRIKLQLDDKAVSHDVAFVPWVGAMNERLAVLVTLFTVVCLPALSAWFIFWLVFSFSGWLSSILSALFLLCGIYCFVLARRIATAFSV